MHKRNAPTVPVPLPKVAPTASRFEPDDGLPVLINHRDLYDPFMLIAKVTYQHAFGPIVIPALFKCDLASIPAILWWIPGFRPFGKIARAALVHDYLYRRQRVNGTRLEREEADMLFRVIAKQDGVWLPARWIMWLAVRLFGGNVWAAHAAANAAGEDK